LAWFLPETGISVEKSDFNQTREAETDLSLANSNFKPLLATEIVCDNASSTDSR
jgi:hypothetical protein